MTPAQFRDRVLLPGAAWTEEHCGTSSSSAALQMLLTIAGQESAWLHRFQISTGLEAGPARSYWQFEKGTPASRGGITGVVLHDATKGKALLLCEAAGVTFSPSAIWRAIEGHDLLAYGMARLLLLTDRPPIPADVDGGWECYVSRTWRPGAAGTPSGKAALRKKWAGNWAQAAEALRAGAETA